MESLEEIERLARRRLSQCTHAAQVEPDQERRMAWTRMAELWQTFAETAASMTLDQATNEVRRLLEIERIGGADGSFH
jgi:hypothetical protein